MTISRSHPAHATASIALSTVFLILLEVYLNDDTVWLINSITPAIFRNIFVTAIEFRLVSTAMFDDTASNVLDRADNDAIIPRCR